MAGKLFFFLLAALLLAMVVASSDVNASEKTGQIMRARTLNPQNCGAACDFRCHLASKHKPCIKYCNLCCQKCLCVPPGTYGHKQACPCYASMRNARGGNKCP